MSQSSRKSLIYMMVRPWAILLIVGISIETSEARVVPPVNSDNTYCGKVETSANGDTSCFKGGALMLPLLVDDFENLLLIFLGNTSHPLQEAGDYLKVMGIRRVPRNFQRLEWLIHYLPVASPENGAVSDFRALNQSEQIGMMAFLAEMDARVRKFRSAGEANSQGLEEAEFDSLKFIQLGSKIDDIRDENGNQLKPGWLWREALKFSRGDPKTAVLLLAMRGIDPMEPFVFSQGKLVSGTPGISKNGNNAVVTPGFEDWTDLPQSLPEEASISAGLEGEIIAAHRKLLPGSESIIEGGIWNKNYHIYTSAYEGCSLASEGHNIRDIVSIEKALASAYRDIDFRKRICMKAKPPAPASAPTSILRDDAVALIAQLKKDNSPTEQKVQSLKNLYNWPEGRFQAAKDLARVWLLDWDWTIAQQTAGARWGAQVCAKPGNH